MTAQGATPPEPAARPARVRGPRDWDTRYAAGSWPTGPSPTVVDALAALPPGRAVDLAAGPGRHTRWLLDRGWSVTAVDASSVGVAQGRARCPQATWVVADVLVWAPSTAVDLVLAAYVQLGSAGFARAAGWLVPGGRLVVVGHALSGLTRSPHGPREPALRHTPQTLRGAAAGLDVERLEEVERPDDGGPSVDAVLVARRRA